MSDEYSYQFPNEDAFLYTIRQYLTMMGDAEIAGLLEDATCKLTSSGSYSGENWNHLDCTVALRVPLRLLVLFTESIRDKIRHAADMVMPEDTGYDVTLVAVSPQLEMPPTNREDGGLNVASQGIAETEIFECDGLRFRSPAEIAIYRVLKQREILFFPNAAAVLGKTGRRLEPDFLVCYAGKWGVLEVMGKRYHTNENASADHNRADKFEDFGLHFVKFREGADCLKNPVDVVDDFLKRLAGS